MTQFATGIVLCSTEPAERRLRRSLSSRGSAASVPARWSVASVAEAPRTTPATARGWSRPTSTKPTGSSTTPSAARVLDRVDRQLAKDVPVIPLYEISLRADAPRTPSGTSSSVARATSSGTRRTGGSSASPRRGRLPSRSSPSREREAQPRSRRRSAAARSSAARRMLPSLPASDVFADGCSQGGGAFPFDMSHVLAGAVRGQSRRHLQGKPRLEGRLHVTRRPFTLDLPHPAGGAVERRSPGHGAGLHLHSPSDTAARDPTVDVTSTPPSARPRARSQDPASGTPPEVRELARSVLGTSCRRTRSAVRISRGSGATGSPIRRPGRPIGSGPFLVGAAGNAAGSSSFAATPATGDRTQPTSSGSSISFAVGSRSQR